MELTFITGNTGKFSEAEAVLEMKLVQKKLDLPEIQSLDAHEVMRAKLEAARAYGTVPCMVEDSSLTFSCLNGKLPGPYIKFFEEALGIKGLVALTQAYGDARATSSTLVGYADEKGDMSFFAGSIKGTIVPPRGNQDFGYGPAFMPEGSEVTLGEMSREEKNTISSRAAAFRKLKAFLES